MDINNAIARLSDEQARNFSLFCARMYVTSDKGKSAIEMMEKYASRKPSEDEYDAEWEPLFTAETAAFVRCNAHDAANLSAIKAVDMAKDADAAYAELESELARLLSA